MLRITSDTKSDGLYTQYIDAPVDHTVEIDKNRIVDVSADGSVVAIDLLAVSEGVNLSGLPTEESIFDEWMELLSREYQVESPGETAKYLRANSFLIGVLFEAPGKIREVFRWDVELTLQIFTDNDDEEGKELFALILTDLSPEESIQKLDILDKEWWVEASTLTRCQLNIDVKHASLS